MTPEMIAHIHDLPVPPVLDVLGKWVHCRNARVATTSMDEGPFRARCIMEQRGRKNRSRAARSAERIHGGFSLSL